MTTADQLDQLLPQTQCQLCEFEGCKPYAEAMANGSAPIDRCLPGGVSTLQALGKQLNIDPTPYLDGMAAKAKPIQTVRIREDECIGCTKCIQACPVDAIVGRNKRMHTVITDECNGCELCIPPCPVDCIDIIPQTNVSSSTIMDKAPQYRQRFEARQARLAREQTTRQQQTTVATASTADRQDAIAAMLKRARKSI